jgi:hypothetical protein
MNEILALLRGYGLKRDNLLSHVPAFTIRASECLLFVFRNPHGEGEFFTTLFTREIIYRHFGTSCWMTRSLLLVGTGVLGSVGAGGEKSLATQLYIITVLND